MTLATSPPPWLWPFAAAVLLPMLPARLRPLLTLAVPLAGAASLYAADLGVQLETTLLQLPLVIYRLDELSRLFLVLFQLAALLVAVFSLHVRDPVQQVAGLVYAGAAMGVVGAGDLVSLFLFWETMAIASTFMIWARRDRRALDTGLRYLAVQLVSGILLLFGILWHVQGGGALALGPLDALTPSGTLIFLAFGIKAAFPLAHNWLTDGYPAATPTGAVFLCVFTTKAAVYALARCFPGTEALIYTGAIMTCFPIFYAVIENDLRRVLAYSMINQLGFMVCGIGIGTAAAINGAVAHAFNDVLFKGLLFMSMGAVLHVTGRINGSDLGGLYKTMPITAGLCLTGAASISAFPLFCGFVSKSLIMVEVLAAGHEWVWLMLLFASAGVFHHAGIKIPFFAFFAEDSGLRAREPPLNMLLAMAGAAALCVAIGCFPQALYALLPYAMDYTPYDASHVLAQLQLLFFSALAFAWLRLSGLYPPELRSVNLDAEWVYRRLLPAGARIAMQAVRAVASRNGQALTGRGKAALERLSIPGLTRDATLGSAALYMLGLLVLCLTLYFLRRAATL